MKIITNDIKQSKTKYGASKILVKCICWCGKEFWTNYYQRNNVQSCGCIKWSKLYPDTYKRNGFGHKDKSIIWRKRHNMIRRCYDKKNDSYWKYGAKWIKVCDRWLDFYNFYDDMNESMQQHLKKYGRSQTTIDRINGNKDYSKENCRRATVTEQNNNLPQCKRFEYNWWLYTIPQISRMCWININTIRSRVYQRWRTIEDATTKIVKNIWQNKS